MSKRAGVEYMIFPMVINGEHVYALRRARPTSWFLLSTPPQTIGFFYTVEEAEAAMKHVQQETRAYDEKLSLVQYDSR